MGKVLVKNQIYIFNEKKIINKLSIKVYKKNKKVINQLIKILDEKALSEINSEPQKKILE